MSIQAMAWAIEQQEIKDSLARHVLLCLANYADNHGKTAFPSTATLVKDTGMSRSTILRKLDLLEEMGLIVKGNQKVVAAYIDRGDRRPVCYDMAMKKRGVTVTPRESERGVTQDGTGCQPDANGVSGRRERGVTVTPNPSLNPSLKPSINQNRDRAVALPDWLSAEAWEKFVAFRKAGNGKRKFTEHAEELLLADLAALRAEGHDPVKVIQQSIKRGWAGLFKISGSRADAPGVTSRDESRAAAAASIGLGAHAHDDEPTVIDADFRRIS